MTRQQAGVSAEAVAKLVAKWNEASDQARNKIVALIFEGCARELEAALATAPPEQAADSELQQKYESLKQQWDALQDHLHEEFVARTQPQPASDGALTLPHELDKESFTRGRHWELAEFQRCLREHNPSIGGLCSWCKAMDERAALAAHDQTCAESHMKLTDSQRKELFDALREPELPEAGSVDAIGQLDEIIAQDIDRIEPIIARWLSEQKP